jgi:hypothetical protein
MNQVIANREKKNCKNTYLVQELDKLKDRKQLIESFILMTKRATKKKKQKLRVCSCR